MTHAQATAVGKIVYGNEPTNSVQYEAAKKLVRQAINEGYRFNILTGEVVRKESAVKM